MFKVSVATFDRRVLTRSPIPGRYRDVCGTDWSRCSRVWCRSCAGNPLGHCIQEQSAEVALECSKVHTLCGNTNGDEPLPESSPALCHHTSSQFQQLRWCDTLSATLQAVGASTSLKWRVIPFSQQHTLRHTASHTRPIPPDLLSEVASLCKGQPIAFWMGKRPWPQLSPEGGVWRRACSARSR